MMRMLYFIRLFVETLFSKKNLLCYNDFYVMVKRKNSQPPSQLIACFKIIRYREKSVV